MFFIERKMKKYIPSSFHGFYLNEAYYLDYNKEYRCVYISHIYSKYIILLDFNIGKNCISCYSLYEYPYNTKNVSYKDYPKYKSKESIKRAISDSIANINKDILLRINE